MPPGDLRTLKADFLLTNVGLAHQVMEAVNREREKKGLSALVRHERLTETARGHSRDMAIRGYMGHVTPDGRTMEDRIRRAAVAYRSVAENVAYNERAKHPDATAVESWMSSTGHRKNILNPSFTHTGVGIAMSRDGKFYFTQLFLLPGE